MSDGLWCGNWSAELPTETGIYWFARDLLKSTNIVVVTVEEVNQDIPTNWRKKKVPMILSWVSVMGPEISDLEGYWAQIQPPDAVYVRPIRDGAPSNCGFFEGVGDFLRQESEGLGHGLLCKMQVEPGNNMWL